MPNLEVPDASQPPAAADLTTSNQPNPQNPTAYATMPPTGLEPEPYISNPFGLIKPAFAALKLYWLKLVILTVTTVIVSFIVLVFFTLSALGGAIVWPVAIVLVPLALYLGAAVSLATLKLSLAAVRGNKLTIRQAWPTKFTELLKYFWTLILLGLVVGFGFVLLIVPGVIFLARYALAPYVLVDEGLYGWAALRRSKDIAQGRGVEVLGALSISSISTILGAVPFVGQYLSIVAAIVLAPVEALRYTTLIQLKTQPNWEATPKSPMNYAALLLGLVASGVVGHREVAQLQTAAGTTTSN